MSDTIGKMVGLERKITPRDDSFDRADHDVPIEVEAYNEGHNNICDTEVTVDVGAIEKAISDIKIDREPFPFLIDRDKLKIAQAIAKAILQGGIVREKK